MSPEIESRLFDAYPDLFRARLGTGDEPIKVWGIECGDGWFKLLFELAAELVGAAEQAGVCADDSSWPQIVQVKQKLGELRIYLEKYDAVYREIIDRNRLRSRQTCEICGEPGELRKSRRNLVVGCPVHLPTNKDSGRSHAPVWLNVKSNPEDE